jgi:hypothetical protein
MVPAHGRVVGGRAYRVVIDGMAVEVGMLSPKLAVVDLEGRAANQRYDPANAHAQLRNPSNGRLSDKRGGNRPARGKVAGRMGF